MSAQLYDDALAAKLKYWTQNLDIHILTSDNTKRLFEILADQNNDKPIQLPVLVLRRDGYQIKETNRKPISYDGITKDASYEKSLVVNAIPIQLTYYIDIYTRYYREADEFVRNIVFNIINTPSLTVNIPYEGQDIEHQSSLLLAQDVSDNSNIPERLIQGQFTRLSLNIIIPDAYLWDVRILDNKHIEEINIIE